MSSPAIAAALCPPSTNSCRSRIVTDPRGSPSRPSTCRRWGAPKPSSQRATRTMVATATHRVGNVVERLLCLVEVDILGRCRRGGDDDVGRRVDAQVEPLVVDGARPRRAPPGSRRPRRRRCGPVVEEHVDDEVDADDGAGLVDVVAHRVSVEDARVPPSSSIMPWLALDDAEAADARQDGLGPAAVPGEVVVVEVPGADLEVCFGVGAGDLERRTARRGADGTHSPVVESRQTPVADFVADEPAPLLVGVPPMAAEREEDRYRLGRNSLQLLQDGHRKRYEGTGRVTSRTRRRPSTPRGQFARAARRSAPPAPRGRKRARPRPRPAPARSGADAPRPPGSAPARATRAVRGRTRAYRPPAALRRPAPRGSDPHSAGLTPWPSAGKRYGGRLERLDRRAWACR